MRMPVIAISFLPSDRLHCCRNTSKPRPVLLPSITSVRSVRVSFCSTDKADKHNSLQNSGIAGPLTKMSHKRIN
jgi:hypothetical protein